MESDVQEEFPRRLRELWTRSGLSLEDLLAFGRRPRVGGEDWTETEVRSWLEGSALPAKDWQFRLLVEHLEETARSRNSDHVGNSVESWYMLYWHAVAARHGVPPRKRSGTPPRTARERDRRSSLAFLSDWRWKADWFSALRKAEHFDRVPEDVASSLWGCLQRHGYRLPVAYADGEVDPTTAFFADTELERAHERLLTALKRFASHSDALVRDTPDHPDVLVLPASLEGRHEAARGMRTAADAMLSAYFALVELIRDRHLVDDTFRFEPTEYGKLAAFPA
ncbi:MULTISPECIES: hypothetical protein [Streptomyces]|uniref:Uncharacterized protein n=1 Tax=Streptomyces viridochromogenes TaxID=1938 RepID=A0A0L8LDF8_STRVR|nr:MULTISPECIES: hypothetical protein [Streptomyces]KOG36157.1 hypothetical protein ADK34_03020 [Streptomyces viridochromogenes]